ncbi:SRPBCC domain-containing protein [Melioribacteraceae bacterium 4301-Me]|uniref:SRPBCC domain-containing protein n=1 Tax=Pyranulibacter aquaticus TaxID=3163344 RepID=UPI0035965663
MSDKTKITVEALINAPIEKVWNYYTQPEHITKWNFASEDWCCPRAQNDLEVGRKFSWRMEAKDGSFGFDFGGVYDEVEKHKKISYTLGDSRKVEINFISQKDSVLVTETFEAEDSHTLEQQRDGWQAILNNFKKYTESTSKLQKVEFKIEINAPAKIVYNIMLGLDNKISYENWTLEFNPTSTFEGSWGKGDEIKFIGTDSNGKKGGMLSKIVEIIPNKFVSIQHIGIIDGEKIITEGSEVESWTGAFENYSFVETNGKTILKIEMDLSEEFKEYFLSTWPKALVKLKEICER